MKPNINFPYELTKARVKKEASYSIWRGLFLAIFTGFALAVILIFALIPGFAEAFDDVETGISTLFILVLMTFSGILGWIIVRSAKRSGNDTQN